MPQVSVLIVNYCAGRWLALSLRALAAQSMPDFEALVIDNASTDGSLEAAQAELHGDARFRFTRLDKNVGFAAANNVAARQAAADLIALLNPDAIPAVDWLEQLVGAANKYPAIAMFGSTQINATDETRLDGCGDNYLFLGLPWRGGFGWPLRELPLGNRFVFAPCGAAALYRRSAFLGIGGFDEEFFCYVEDVDLAFRLRLIGHRCMQITEAKVRHVSNACSKPQSTFAQYHGIRNMVWCFTKNMPWQLLIVLLPLHAAVMISLWIRSLSRRQGRVTASALVDAVTRLPWGARWEVQATRTAYWWTIASALTWSPRLYLSRAPVGNQADGG